MATMRSAPIFRLSRLVAPVLLLILAWAGPAVAADPKIELAIRDQQWVPNEVEVPANTKVELVIKNEQKKAAEFERPCAAPRKGRAAGWPGQPVRSGRMKPGRYEFVDDFNKAARGFIVVK
jgi:hypothetical protein